MRKTSGAQLLPPTKEQRGAAEKTSISNGVSPNYLEDQAEAAMYFYDWFLGHSAETFGEMIPGAHRRAAIGDSGQKPYAKREGKLSFSSRDLHPGIFWIDVIKEERGATHFGSAFSDSPRPRIDIFIP